MGGFPPAQGGAGAPGQGMPQQGMPGQGMAPNMNPNMMQGMPAQGGPLPTNPLVPQPKQSSVNKTTLFMVLAIIGGLVAVTFIALFIWMYSQWSTAKEDVDSQIDAAVATAVNEKAEEMENQFTEREKSPYNTFAGPIDYGELAFEYPKTWSVYEAKDAANGGDYEAYLNPDKVYPTGTSTINALRVIIADQSYDNYIKQYEQNVKNGKLTVSVRPINGENANLYTGEQPSGKLQGIAAIFRIRDKTAVIQTDAMLFEEDYLRVLDSVRFNQ